MSELRSRMNAMEVSHDNIDFEPRIRRPLIRQTPPVKATIVALLLFIGGLFFLCFGLSILFSTIIAHGKDRGLAMIILGGISKLLNFTNVVSTSLDLIPFPCFRSVYSR